MAAHHLQALDLVARGDWDGAHHIIQRHEDSLACLVHGYLHRIEGDNSNAAYWYRRAGHSLPDNTLQEEYARLYRQAGPV